MFLDAYYKLQFIAAYGSMMYNETDTNGSLTNGIMLYDTTGTQQTSWRYSNSANGGNPFLFPLKGIISQTTTGKLGYINNKANIIVGAGTAPVTASDHKLESEIITNLTCDFVNAVANYEAGELYAKKTMTNVGSDAMTITEIGMTANNCCYNAVQFLVYREVLDTPIVVAPGESFTITITYKFTLPG